MKAIYSNRASICKCSNPGPAVQKPTWRVDMEAAETLGAGKIGMGMKIVR
jgi:hypothetical protein